MKDEQDDPLWELLGKAREPKGSPFFASKVLRALHEEQKSAEGLMAWVRSRWLISFGMTAAAVIAIWLSLKPGQPTAPSKISESVVMTDLKGMDADIIEELDELIAYEDTSLWLEADSSSLY